MEAIQIEPERATYLSYLAKVDTADLSVLATAARLVHDECNRASILIELANIDAAYFPEALATVHAIQDEYNRAQTLCRIAEKLPDELIGTVFTMIPTFTCKKDQALVLRYYLPRIPLTTLADSDWQAHLHLLAYQRRDLLLDALVTLYPAILHLGGEAAMRGVVDVMREVCDQWE